MRNATQATAPFRLGERLVAFDSGGRAADVAPTDLGRRAPAWLMGVVDATDDRSVDAAFWERHPGGDKILYVLEGSIALTLAHEEAESTMCVGAGQACIVPRAVWHRLRVVVPGRLLFMTPTAGTESRRYAAWRREGRHPGEPIASVLPSFELPDDAAETIPEN
jgi:mannose-6-phosphate isomerase-like protein (cupin superfamily)